MFPIETSGVRWEIPVTNWAASCMSCPVVCLPLQWGGRSQWQTGQPRACLVLLYACPFSEMGDPSDKQWWGSLVHVLSCCMPAPSVRWEIPVTNNDEAASCMSSPVVCLPLQWDGRSQWQTMMRQPRACLVLLYAPSAEGEPRTSASYCLLRHYNHEYKTTCHTNVWRNQNAPFTKVK
jgi:hypothetical protein